MYFQVSVYIKWLCESKQLKWLIVHRTISTRLLNDPLRCYYNSGSSVNNMAPPPTHISYWRNNFHSLCYHFSFSCKHRFLSLALQIGWIYGSVTEDILTGFKMHARGWRSIYCMPKRPAFKGSAPINLSDRLNQVLRWALGSVEILFSRHCPIWYGYGGRLKFLERFAYVNTTIYPLTAIPLLMYCTLPAVCLLTNKFIMPQVFNHYNYITSSFF